jgi:hypothetical protein
MYNILNGQNAFKRYLYQWNVSNSVIKNACKVECTLSNLYRLHKHFLNVNTKSKYHAIFHQRSFRAALLPGKQWISQQRQLLTIVTENTTCK